MAEASAEKNKTRKRSSLQRQEKEKRRKQATSSLSLAIPGEGDCLKLKIDKKLLEEFKLVGRSEFPNSLLYYVDDRERLLEEMFNIFSREDVKGLLPDTLKGFKLKKIKSLCRHQLSLTDRNALEKIITGEQDCVVASKETTNKDDHGQKEDISAKSTPSSITKQFSDVSDGDEERIHDRPVLQADKTKSTPHVAAGLTSKAGEQDIASVLSGTVGCRNNEGSSIHDDFLAIAPSIVDAVDFELSGRVYEKAKCGKQSHHSNDDAFLTRNDSQTHGCVSEIVAQNAPSSNTVETLLREKLLPKAKSHSLKPKSLEPKSELGTPNTVENSASLQSPEVLEQKMKEKALRSLLMKNVRLSHPG